MNRASNRGRETAAGLMSQLQAMQQQAQRDGLHDAEKRVRKGLYDSLAGELTQAVLAQKEA